jgi:hypothetical protein
MGITLWNLMFALKVEEALELTQMSLRHHNTLGLALHKLQLFLPKTIFSSMRMLQR